MKGECTLDGKPFRFGGLFCSDFDKDCEEWAKEHPIMSRCFACGHTMDKGYPYMAAFKITKGKGKGLFRFRALCRACAYDFGSGVVEMDGETYRYPYDFDEGKYKRDRSGYDAGQETSDASAE